MDTVNVAGPVVPLIPTFRLLRPRKLHLGHFAFMRALVQGLDTRASWDRYLRVEGEHRDIRTVKKTIAWLRDEFAAAAKRYDRHGTARLVKIDASVIVDAAPSLPTLDDFVVERGMEDFSEAEQLEAYQAKYGNATQRASRRARVIARQLDALKWLENLVAEPPRAQDAVSSWLHPDLAWRLEAAGLATLQQLADRINDSGVRWWRSIPAIGEAKAQRIVDWLRAHEATLGTALAWHALARRRQLPASALQAVVPRATTIVPIEKLIVPAELSGASGLYRLPQHLCLMSATNDYEAILAWVRSKNGLSAATRAVLMRKRGINPDHEGPFDWLRLLSNTQRAYLREAERFLLWAIVQRHKPLSSMTLEDCTAYRDFLGDPQPAATWCGPHAKERWHPQWRPFAGPLAATAQRRTVAALKSLYRFLTDQCYLRGNPWGGVTTPKAAGRGIDPGRSLTQGQWDFIEERLQALPATSANRRLRFALHLFYATGLRLSEAIAARVADLSWHAYPPGRPGDETIEVWELSVVGKGDKLRKVPLAPHVVDELRDYLASRRLPNRLPDPSSQTHLIGLAADVAERAPWSPAAKKPIDPHAGIAADTLYDQLKGFFAGCAKAMAGTDPHGAAHLKQASVHWLRHTYGSHAVAAGTDVKVVQENLGHASLATTTIYTATEERRRAQETAKLWLASAWPPAAGGTRTTDGESS